MCDAVVLLSGGLDSTVLLSTVIRRLRDPRRVLSVSFEYGQKHAVEVVKARRIAEYYDCGHRVVELPRVFGGDSSVLEGGPSNPHLTYQELAQAEGPSQTVVPFRNANLISQAATIAVTVEAAEVYVGVHAEDAQNWAYPDCTPEFIGAMANAVYIGTYNTVRLVTPFQWLTKDDIVATGIRHQVPFELTMSCYDGAEPACGKCPTCVERLAAFAECGVRDPLEYA